MREIIHYLGVSASLAQDYVEKAVEQDKIVIYNLRTAPGTRITRLKRRKLQESSLYVARTSDLLSQGLTEFEANTLRMTKEGEETTFPRVKSTSTTTKNPDLYRMTERGSSQEKPTSSSFPKLDTHATKLVKKTDVERLLQRKYSSHERTKILTPSEEISILTALSLQPLSFMDLHSQFKAAKSTVKTFIKRGLIQEVWGPKDIGVKYKLAKKGKSHLKKLKAAAKLGIDEIGKARIQLKHKLV